MGRRGSSKYDGKYTAGQVVGDWTVVDGILHATPSRRAQLLLRCKCNTEHMVDVYSLAAGNSNCCKNCATSRKGAENPNWKGDGVISATFAYNAMRSSKVDQSEYQLTTTDLNQLYVSQTGSCSITGLAINTADNSAKLLRIDQSQPYALGNVTMVHSAISTNHIKPDVLAQLGFSRGGVYAQSKKEQEDSK